MSSSNDKQNKKRFSVDAQRRQMQAQRSEKLISSNSPTKTNTNQKNNSKKRQAPQNSKTPLKKQPNKKQSSPKAKEKMPLKKKIGFGLLGIFIVVLIICVGLFIYGYLTTPELDINNFSFIQNSKVLDKDGNYYQDYQASENREVVKIEQIPDYVQNAFVSIEDERFYQHHGVDIPGLGRAILGVATSGSLSGPGGSTITQQLIKLTHLTSDKTISRKLQEMILAVRLEQVYTKTQILEAYLNKINLSQAWGIQAAAKTYFNCDVSELTIAQAAMLAAMPKSPSYYDPYVYVEDENGNSIISVDANNQYALNPENQKRAIIILDKMLELGYINQIDHDTAQAQIEGNVVGLTYVEREIEYSYFTDSVYDQVVSDLMKKRDMTEDAASEYLLNGGLTIYSTVDPSVQSIMEAAASNDNLFPSQSSEAAQASAAKQADTGDDVNYIPQVGMTVIDNSTGYVSGIVGGREKHTNLSLNRATQRFQPGSSTKPLTTYGPGLDTGAITLGTVYNDVPISYQGWQPGNAEGTFKGLTTIRQGLVNSTNTIAVQACLATGIETCAQYGEKIGLHINREEGLDVNPASLSLGGYSEGQSPLVMASAYSTLANKGEHKSYSFYTKVVDASGKTILENESTTTQVYKPQTTYLLTDVLQQVLNGGTATINIGGQEVAGKTGTTDEERHAWLCGYTPYYSMAVWYGYDENTVETSSGTYNLNINLRGGSKPGPGAMFESVMTSLHENLDNKNFDDMTDGIVTATIDTCSGKLATNLSTSVGTVANEKYISGTEPTENDDSHSQVKLCSVSHKIPTDYCPTDMQTVLTIPKDIYPSGITPVDPNYVGTNDIASIAPTPTDICQVHSASNKSSTTTEMTLKLDGTTFTSSSTTMNAGETHHLTISSKSNDISVDSSNPSVVSLDTNGNIVTINALSQGTATITISDSSTSNSGNTTPSKSFSITVN